MELTSNGSHAIGWRWLVLLPLFAGFLLDPLVGSVEFVLLNSICIGACALLLTRLDQPPTETLWVWVVLVIFILGYFVKSYIIAEGFDYFKYEASWFDELREIVTVPMIIDGFPYVALGFVTFCFVAWYLVGPDRHPDMATVPEVVVAPGRLWPMVVALFIASVFLSAIRGKYQVGVHGLEGGNAATALPFRLGTVVVRGHEVLSMLQLVTIWAAERSESAADRRFAIGAAALACLVISLATASRSALLGLALPIFFLWLLAGRLTRVRVVALLLLGVAFLALFPFLDALRYARVAGQTDIMDALRLAQSVAGKIGIVESIRLSAFPIVFRFIGADGVWFALHDGAFSIARLHRLLFGEGLTAYYTETVVGTVQERTFRSPGLIGAGLLFGGAGGLVVLVGTTLLFVRILWTRIANLRCAPAAQALTAVFVYSLINEGTFYLQNILAFCLAIGICELVTRTYLLAPMPLPLGRET